MHSPRFQLKSKLVMHDYQNAVLYQKNYSSFQHITNNQFAICSLVGSLNKIPLSVAGILLFKVPTSLENSASILFGQFFTLTESLHLLLPLLFSKSCTSLCYVLDSMLKVEMQIAGLLAGVLFARAKIRERSQS